MEAQAADKRCWELTADLVLHQGHTSTRKLLEPTESWRLRTPGQARGGKGNGKSGKGRGNQGEKGSAWSERVKVAKAKRIAPSSRAHSLQTATSWLWLRHSCGADSCPCPTQYSAVVTSCSAGLHACL